jgi:hypothetical protein
MQKKLPGTTGPNVTGDARERMLITRGYKPALFDIDFNWREGFTPDKEAIEKWQNYAIAVQRHMQFASATINTVGERQLATTETFLRQRPNGGGGVQYCISVYTYTYGVRQWMWRIFYLPLRRVISAKNLVNTFRTELLRDMAERARQSEAQGAD